MSWVSVPQVPYGLMYLTCHFRSPPPPADCATSTASQPRDLRYRRTVFLLPADSPATWPDKSPDMSCSHVYFFLASQTYTWHTIGLSDGSMLRRAVAYTPPQTLPAPKRPCRCSCRPNPPPIVVARHNRLRHGALATAATSPPTSTITSRRAAEPAYVHLFNVHTHVTYLYNLVGPYGFYTRLYIYLFNINDEGVSSDLSRSCVWVWSKFKGKGLYQSKRLSTIALLWSWWSERNRGNHGELRLMIDQFQSTVQRHVYEWNQFLSKRKKTNICQTSTWTPPDEATVKINIDAAFREQTNNDGWGVICRQWFRYLFRCC
jgi:hypothetical protein